MYVALAAFVAWRVHARFKRLVGRQRLSRYRAPITIGVFGTLLAVVALATASHPPHLWLLAGAVLAGVALSRWGLARTQFEAVRGVGLFYTPCSRIGVALSLLFVARIAYRVVEQAGAAPGDFLRSPLTLVAFGLPAAYYVAYAVGLARWRARVLAARQREPGAAP